MDFCDDYLKHSAPLPLRFPTAKKALVKLRAGTPQYTLTDKAHQGHFGLLLI
jgi:hypothetical protein